MLGSSGLALPKWKKRNQQISHTCKSRLASLLSPFIDGGETVRVGGRIDRADISLSSRHLIVLSPDHKLSRLIIIDCHEKQDTMVLSMCGTY